MADMSKAEKLASAKKKLKQFQQKNRDTQSESGRSTPSKKKLEDDDPVGKVLQSENGGSTLSLTHSENLSSNISRTESPLLMSNSSLDNLCHAFNGSFQPDVLNVSNALNSLPKVSESFFKSPSPQMFFPENNPSPGSEFFDSLSSRNGQPNNSFQSAPGQLAPPTNRLLDQSALQSLPISTSTPDNPQFQETPNYSFPDISCSPILTAKQNTVLEDPTSTVSDLEANLKNSASRNSDLEQELSEQKNQILQLQSHLEEMKQKSDEEAATLKHHIQAIEILVSEKTELQNTLDRRLEEFQCKSEELEECQGRLRASRHRVSDLERDLTITRNQLAATETSLREEKNHTAQLDKVSDTLGKRVSDLELEVSDLQNKLANQNRTINLQQAEINEKTSQLSLAEIKVQQLTRVPGADNKVEEELSQRNEEMLNTIMKLEGRLAVETAAREESMKEYQHYVNRLQTELQEANSALDTAKSQSKLLADREQHLLHQVSELEKQVQRATQLQPQVLLSIETALQEQLQVAEDDQQALRVQLHEQSVELALLREGLQERSLRIQELESTVNRLEAEQPDSTSLQAAIESDKVAASRAIAQNNNLKRQLEELQEALVKLSNNKLELTQQLHHEQHQSQDLREKLGKIQEPRRSEMEQAQQTDNPSIEEREVQTIEIQTAVSSKAMEKLEDKFRRTMSELAEMSDEKQRLEHLVTQLQGETETIGEYITLYQIQRGMLRQRAQEKDEQVSRLARDKESLRNQLAQLNCLVQRLVKSSSPHLTADEVNGHEPEVVSEEANESECPILSTTQAAVTTNIETAEQIRSLLTEIGSNTLVTLSGESTNINFHPCPWCSGRLITV